MEDRLNRLTRVFRSGLCVALSTTPVVVSGCGGQDTPGIETDPDFVSRECGESGTGGLSDLRLAAGVDYLEIRGSSLEATTPDIAVGEACSTATDAADCAQRLEVARSESPISCVGQAPACVYAAATQGDDAFAITSVAELGELLVPIDTADEAMLLIVAEGYGIPCERGGTLKRSDHYQVQAFAHVGCDGRTRYLFRVDSNAQVTLLDQWVEQEPDPNCAVGRRPSGLHRERPRGRSRLARYLAQTAHLEAASIYAFQKLQRELGQYDAPLNLQLKARAAMMDEVRHAAAMAFHARRFGGHPKAARVALRPTANLEELALENAVEGCVRETFGAMVAHLQAHRAGDAKLRRSLRTIALEETKHAALSWELADWLKPRLSSASRRRIRDQERAAWLELRNEVREDLGPVLEAVAGVPRPRPASRMLRHLERELGVSS